MADTVRRAERDIKLYPADHTGASVVASVVSCATGSCISDGVMEAGSGVRLWYVLRMTQHCE